MGSVVGEGQYFPAGQRSSLVLPSGHVLPTRQRSLDVTVAQENPASQRLLAVDPLGQNEPLEHSSLEVGSTQK